MASNETSCNYVYSVEMTNPLWNDDESLNNSSALTREENEMAGDATYTRATMKQLYNELLCSFISRPM